MAGGGIGEALVFGGRRVVDGMCVGIIRVQPMRRNLSAYLSSSPAPAIMLFIGVSAVAFMWAPGSPVPVGPNGALRRLLTGHHVCRRRAPPSSIRRSADQRRTHQSGRHLAFWRLGKVPTRDAVIYVVMQFAARSRRLGRRCGLGPLTTGVQYAATVPGEATRGPARSRPRPLITFLLVFTIFRVRQQAAHRAADRHHLPARWSRCWS
jgi:hypothetical protein